jgi:hypothetical protein
MQLENASGDDERVLELVEEIEESWDEDNVAECDKAWDAMHRALTTGELEYGGGPYPLSHCVLGPRQLYQGDDYIVSLVSAHEVKDVATTLANVTEASFGELYRTIVPQDYAPEYGDEDLEYTWSWFERVRDLYTKAAAQDRAVLFTVDQ